MLTRQPPSTFQNASPMHKRHMFLATGHWPPCMCGTVSRLSAQARLPHACYQAPLAMPGRDGCLLECHCRPTSIWHSPGLSAAWRAARQAPRWRARASPPAPAPCPCPPLAAPAAAARPAPAPPRTLAAAAAPRMGPRTPPAHAAAAPAGGPAPLQGALPSPARPGRPASPSRPQSLRTLHEG